MRSRHPFGHGFDLQVFDTELIFGETAVTGGHLNPFVGCVTLWENNAKCFLILPPKLRNLSYLRKFLNNVYNCLVCTFWVHPYATFAQRSLKHGLTHTLRRFTHFA